MDVNVNVEFPTLVVCPSKSSHRSRVTSLAPSTGLAKANVKACNNFGLPQKKVRQENNADASSVKLKPKHKVKWLYMLTFTDSKRLPPFQSHAGRAALLTTFLCCEPLIG